MSDITVEQLGELIAQAKSKDGKPPRVTRENLQTFLRNPDGFVAGGTQYLRLLPGQPLTIGPTSGSRIIANAVDVFKAGIDGDFNNWGVNRPAKETEEMVISPPYELVTNGKFAEIFGSLSADPRRLCWTQDQIIKYVVTHPDQLGANRNFFLTESGGEFFVVDVYVYDDGRLNADVGRFDLARVWRAEDRHRFFAPQLANPLAV
ncbi:MAG: hypothetical protein WCT37_02865 [Patescibacteria group bacterium]|jgi:hypothetical protein